MEQIIPYDKDGRAEDKVIISLKIYELCFFICLPRVLFTVINMLQKLKYILLA